MKKYLFIYKLEIMSKLQYIADTLAGFIGYFILIFIFMNLWQYVYSDSSSVINGYTINQTIWYVIVTEIIWGCIGGRKLTRKISEDVKSGNIAYNMNKPYSYIGYALSSHFGEVTIKLIIYGILGMVVGILFLGSFPDLNILNIILILIIIIFALLINSLFIMCIGLLSFYIEDSGPIYWIYSKLILLLGTIFPIEFFPKTLAKILTYSPIVSMNYGPAKLFVNFSYKNCLFIIISQIIYLIISYFLCTLIYKKGVKKLNVNGG